MKHSISKLIENNHNISTHSWQEFSVSLYGLIYNLKSGLLKHLPILLISAPYIVPTFSPLWGEGGSNIESMWWGAGGEGSGRRWRSSGMRLGGAWRGGMEQVGEQVGRS